MDLCAKARSTSSPALGAGSERAKNGGRGGGRHKVCAARAFWRSAAAATTLAIQSQRRHEWLCFVERALRARRYLAAATRFITSATSFIRLPLLPRLVREHEIDAAAERRMRVAPPFDEARRARIGFRILGEFHERAGHRFVQVRQLEAEDVGLMLDVARVAGVDGRKQKREHAADGEQPRDAPPDRRDRQLSSARPNARGPIRRGAAR